MGKPRGHYTERRFTRAGKCESCGKKIYFTRKEAKSAIRNFYRDKYLAIYSCNGYYHVGHAQRKAK